MLSTTLFRPTSRPDARHASRGWQELIVDNFAGGGGASLGIERAAGRAVDVSILTDRSGGLGKRRMTLKQFRGRATAGLFDPNDLGACSCFTVDADATSPLPVSEWSVAK